MAGGGGGWGRRVYPSLNLRALGVDRCSVWLYDTALVSAHTALNCLWLLSPNQRNFVFGLRVCRVYRTGDFRSYKLNHHCTRSAYVHSIRHFAVLLCWTHGTDWSTDDAGGTRQCRYQVVETRNSYLERRWKNIHYFLIDFRMYMIHVLGCLRGPLWSRLGGWHFASCSWKYGIESWLLTRSYAWELHWFYSTFTSSLNVWMVL
jgi:hypothetical protein